MYHYKNEKKVCAFCGQEHVYKALEYKTKSFKVFLDGKPTDGDLSSFTLEICPYCGYVAEDISNKTDILYLPSIKEIIDSKLYQEILKTDINKFVKTHLLKHEISKVGSSVDNTNFLYISWYYENICDEENRIFYVNKYINELKKGLEIDRALNYKDAPEKMFLEDPHTQSVYFSLLEAYRLIGYFNTASNIIDNYEKVESEYLTKIRKSILKTEKKLCKKKISHRV